MDTPDRKTAYVGRQLGRALRGFVRQEARLMRWMMSHGMPRRVAEAICWIVKLTVLGLLLYMAFWFALIIVLAAVGAWLARDAGDIEEDEGEWRNGLEGYGYYERGVRTDYGRLFEDDRE